MNDFNIKDVENEFNILIDAFKNHENFKYNPRNCFDRIFSKIMLNINNKKVLLTSVATITNTQVNNLNTLRVVPFEKSNARYIESALLQEYNKGFGDRVEKEDGAFVIYLPSIITQKNIDDIVNELFKPIVDSYLHIKLKEVREKYHAKIKPMQAKQRDLFNKHREQIDNESNKYTKQIQTFISNIEKKYNIKI